MRGHRAPVANPRRVHQLASTNPVMMSQMPHQPATMAMPPMPSKNENTIPRPSPALRTPTSKVTALRFRISNPVQLAME